MRTRVRSGHALFPFAIHFATRDVRFARITTNPNSAFMLQVARQWTDNFDGPLLECQYLVMDRDPKFTRSFKAFWRRKRLAGVLSFYHREAA